MRGGEEEEAREAQGIDALVRTGSVVECSREGGGCRGWDEYFNYAVELAALLHFFEEACPPSARRSVYADLSLLSYLQLSVPTARFKPSQHGFAHNWMYFYNKPISNEQGAVRGSISSGVVREDRDVRIAERLRAISGLPSLKAARGEDLELLAAQLRSVIEMYCQSFMGALVSVPLPAFLMLGKLALVDHMEALGYSEFGEKSDKDLEALITEVLRSAASIFQVKTSPAI